MTIKNITTRKLLFIAKNVAAVYVVLLLVVALNQRALLFPGASSQHTDEANFTPLKGEQLIPLMTPRLQIPIIILTATAFKADGNPDPKWASRPTLLYFYGNGNHLANTTDVVESLRLLDVNVIATEYPGYGLSGGSVSEEGCYDAAEAAYDFATTKLHVPENRIIAAGWSLGSGVAVHLASVRPVGGLVMCSSYTSMAEMGARRYPIPLPLVRLVLLDHFPSEQSIKKVRCPIFIAHGDADPMIPFSMSVRLAKAAKAPVTFVRIPGVAHNDFFSDGGHALFPKLAAWIRANFKA